MATTNLTLAKHLDGSAVKESDIKVGLLVEFPSSTGGVLEHKCISVDSEKAEFTSTNKDWPGCYVIEFNQPDFTRADFEQLEQALKAFGSWNTLPTDEQHQIVNRAKALGYAYKISHTQAAWLERGIEAYNALKPE